MQLSAWVAFVIALPLSGCISGSEYPCEYGEDKCDSPPPPDPNCRGEGSGYCSGDVPVSCSLDGSSYVVGDCAAERTPRTCVEGGSGSPFCAVSHEQDERCQTDPGRVSCDQDVLTVCREGFVEQIQVCPGGACIDHAAHQSFCALSIERDPRCMNDEGVALERQFCADDWIVHCFDGYAMLFHDCIPQQCSNSPDAKIAFCF